MCVCAICDVESRIHVGNMANVPTERRKSLDVLTVSDHLKLLNKQPAVFIHKVGVCNVCVKEAVSQMPCCTSSPQQHTYCLNIIAKLERSLANGKLTDLSDR